MGPSHGLALPCNHVVVKLQSWGGVLIGDDSAATNLSLMGGPTGPPFPPSDFAHKVRFLAAESSPIGTPPRDRRWTPTWLQGG